MLICITGVVALIMKNIENLPLKKSLSTVYDRNSPFKSEVPSIDADSDRILTIFERDRKVRIYLEEKIIELSTNGLKLCFNAKANNLIKYDPISLDLIPVSKSEKLFYLKVFLKYITRIRLWNPDLEF